MEKIGLLLVTFVLCPLHINITDSFVAIIPVLSKVVCKFDERLINISYVFEQPDSTTNQSLSFEAQTIRELKDMKMTVAYYVVSSESMNRLIKRTVDVCTYVKRPGSDRLVKVVYDHMARNNRLPTVCPIPAKEKFYIRNLRPAAISIPGFLPESNFIFDTSFHTGALVQPLFQLRYHGRLGRIALFTFTSGTGCLDLLSNMLKQTEKIDEAFMDLNGEYGGKCASVRTESFRTDSKVVRQIRLV